MKHPGGRPPIPPESRRTHILRVRVTERDADALYRAAAKRRRDLAKLLHDCCQQLLHDDPPPQFT